MIGKLKILNDIYERDLIILNNVRIYVAHEMEIDEKKVKGFLHYTHTYNYNKGKMRGLTLQEKNYNISLRALYILRHHHGQFVASYLNKLDGWKGSYYNYDWRIRKFFVVFIIGVIVIAIGMTISLPTVVLLGGLLSGVSALIMLVSAFADKIK